MVTFDLSNVTLAFSTASTHDEAFALMQADMTAWHEAGEFPSNGELATAIAAGMSHLGKGTLKVYASRVLKWARSGQAPSNIRAVVNTDPKGASKGKGGRPKGKGKGKTTSTATTTDAPALSTVDSAKTVLRGLLAVKTKLVPLANVDRFENALTEALACLTSVK